MRRDDPEVVACEYASEERLFVRRVVFRDFVDREAVRRSVASTIRRAHLAGSIPPFERPFRARWRATVFLAEKAP